MNPPPTTLLLRGGDKLLPLRQPVALLAVDDVMIKHVHFYKILSKQSACTAPDVAGSKSSPFPCRLISKHYISRENRGCTRSVVLRLLPLLI